MEASSNIDMEILSLSLRPSSSSPVTQSGQPRTRCDRQPAVCSLWSAQTKRNVLLGGTGSRCSLRRRRDQRDGAGARLCRVNYSRKTWRAHAPRLLMITELTRRTERAVLWDRGQQQGAEGKDKEEEWAPRESGSVAGLGRGDALRC